MSQHIDTLTAINTRINAITDPWCTSSALGTGTAEPMALAKFDALTAEGARPELLYCIRIDTETNKRQSHMVCLAGSLALDNQADEIHRVDDLMSLIPVYAITARGLRNWGSERIMTVTPGNAFYDLIQRLQAVTEAAATADPGTSSSP
jgi:hypothetical protein